MDETILCIRCGARKDMLMEECDACHFDPSDDELGEIKSIYLSTLRYEFESEKEQYREELKRFAQRLKNGEEIEYAKEELDRVGELRAAFMASRRVVSKSVLATLRTNGRHVPDLPNAGLVVTFSIVQHARLLRRKPRDRFAIQRTAEAGARDLQQAVGFEGEGLLDDLFDLRHAGLVFDSAGDVLRSAGIKF